MQQIINHISHLSQILREIGSQKLFLVVDSSYPFLNIKDTIEALPVKEKVIFSDFTPNPLYEQVCNGIELLNSSNCDTILAIGGGSTIDVAKCIKLYCKMSNDKIYLDQEYKDTGVKLIAIPTTAGTGSESTRYAVIYYEGKKQSVTHDSIVPDIAILEPSVLKTLPLYQKKCTMLDAFCQGIESWWSINSTDDSKRLSKAAVEEVTKWWHEYIFENTDESANHIMHASNLAGQAICITQTTAAHAFSYKITSLYKLPHGHAVAVCLPEIWEYMIGHMEKCLDKRGPAYLKSVFVDIAKCMGAKTPSEAIKIIRDMMKDMDLQNPTSSLSHRISEIELLCSSVNPVRLKNNPIALDEESIVFLYKKIIKSHECEYNYR